MLVSFDRLIHAFEEADDWAEALQYLYDNWKTDRDNCNDCICACLEYWYVLTCYDQQKPYARDISVESCCQRLNEMTAYGLERFADDPAFNALLGYCIALFPFFFLDCGIGAGVESIEAFGISMMDHAQKIAPDDLDIRLLHAGIHNRKVNTTPCGGELTSWEDTAVRNYFMSIICQAGKP